MKTRRFILVGVTATITLSGCSQTNNQSSQKANSESNGDEFTMSEFLVGGEPPKEYEAELLMGGSSGQVAQTLNPELSYQLSGVGGKVETQVKFEYSERTIPEDEPLNEIVEGETHTEDGEYTQKPGVPNRVVEESLQKPKNFHATFEATDTNTGKIQSEEYELDLAGSWVESAYKVIFTRESYATGDANLKSVKAENGTISINYESKNENGSQGYSNEIAGISGRYTASVARTRIPYNLTISVKDSNGDLYEEELDNKFAKQHLNGEIDEGLFSRIVLFDEILD